MTQKRPSLLELRRKRRLLLEGRSAATHGLNTVNILNATNTVKIIPTLD